MNKIFFIILFIIIGFCIFMAVITGKSRSNGKKKRKDFENKINSIDKIYSIMEYFEQDGLPIVTQGVLALILCKDKIIISDNTHDFSINREQIKEVKYYSEKDIKKELKTSTLKGVAGAAVLGTSGAVIGSQPKEKTVSNVNVSDLYIKYVSTKGTDEVIKLRSRNMNISNTSYRMKEFEAKANEVLLYDKNLQGTIQL